MLCPLASRSDLVSKTEPVNTRLISNAGKRTTLICKNLRVFHKMEIFVWAKNQLINILKFESSNLIKASKSKKSKSRIFKFV